MGYPPRMVRERAADDQFWRFPPDYPNRRQRSVCRDQPVRRLCNRGKEEASGWVWPGATVARHLARPTPSAFIAGQPVAATFPMLSVGDLTLPEHRSAFRSGSSGRLIPSSGDVRLENGERRFARMIELAAGQGFSDAAVSLLAGLSARPGAKATFHNVTDRNRRPPTWEFNVQAGQLRISGSEPRVIVETSRTDPRYHVTRFGAIGPTRLIALREWGDVTVRLQDAELYVLAAQDRRGLLTSLGRTPRLIGDGRILAYVRGLDVPTFTPLAGAQRLEMPIELLALHVPGEDKARYDCDFRARPTGDFILDLPHAHGTWDRGGLAARLTIGRPMVDTEFEQGNRVHLGNDPRVAIDLHRSGTTDITSDSPVLRVRRDVDGVDLAFVFHDYRLRIRGNEAQLVSGQTGRRGVHFNPQHLQEEVFSDPLPASGGQRFFSFFSSWLASGMVQAAPTPAVTVEFRTVGATASYGADGGATTLLARTRAAGRSRIIFDRSDDSANPVPLRVEALTDWSRFSLNVAPRAVGDLPLERQLSDIARITPNMDQVQAQAQVAASLTEPGPNETALELVTGLVFSPDGTAHFRTPRTAPAEQSAALWSARLDLQPSISGNAASSLARVRAIWSAGFQPSNHIGPRVGGEDPPDVDYRTSIDASDRREIVMLSSAFGLGALRAVDLNGQDVPHSLVAVRSHLPLSLS